MGEIKAPRRDIDIDVVLDREQYVALADPTKNGVLKIDGFLCQEELDAINSEISDPGVIDWFDEPEDFTNERNILIQQHFQPFAFKLSGGDQSRLQSLIAINQARHKTERFIRSLGQIFPRLYKWEADELSIHRYTGDSVGISPHRDNRRFIGVIAILAVNGTCGLTVISPDKSEVTYDTNPGDLTLLRAPRLTPMIIDEDDELRPEHAVVNPSKNRVSIMLRANSMPDETIPRFSYVNWPSEIA